jgi:Trypsin-like peptidase domain
MRLSDDHVEALLELLQRCTALITTKDQRSNGAGFFIDDRTILTCAHVVKHGDTVNVTPYMRHTRTGRVDQIRLASDGDMALIKLDESDDVDESNDGEGPQPVALIDVNADRGPYHVAGFPADEMSFAGFSADEMSRHGVEVIPYDGTPRRLQRSGALVAIQLRGNQVTYGMSGGPVLNDRTGAVVGLVRYTRDPDSVLGGGAIPIALVAQVFNDVEKAVKSPPPATGLWREAVPSPTWRAVGRYWPTATPALDICISGHVRRWAVALKTHEHDPAKAQQVTHRDLDEELAEVLFNWAQTRRMQGRGEVQLLGRLLSSALLPKALAQRLRDMREVSGSHELYVRLHTDHSDNTGAEAARELNKLVDVPWELATVPGTQESLGAAQGIRFARVMTNLGTDGDSFVRRAESIPVLAMVIHPGGFTYPTFFDDGKRVRSDSAGAVTKALRDAMKAPQFVPDVRENPAAWEIDQLLGAHHHGFDVFHYIGLGRLGEDGPEFAMSDDADLATWKSAHTLCDWIAQSGARVAMIEFIKPPTALDLQPVRPSLLIPAMSSGVQAVVATRVPVDAHQFRLFNGGFYTSIGEGRTVEAAVQAGRRRLQVEHPRRDYAGFGWFTVTTGERAGLRLYAQQSVGPAQTELGIRAQAYIDPPMEAKEPLNDAFTFSH